MHTGLPTVIENDANAMTYAEWKYGAGRGRTNVVCVTLGTGVGGGLILDGKLYRGSRLAISNRPTIEDQSRGTRHHRSASASVSPAGTASRPPLVDARRSSNLRRRSATIGARSARARRSVVSPGSVSRS